MDPEPRIMQGFIDHTVRWALALPAPVRRAVVIAARDQAHLNRHAQRGEPQDDHVGDPQLWDEIADRIENEGHTPAT